MFQWHSELRPNPGRGDAVARPFFAIGRADSKPAGRFTHAIGAAFHAGRCLACTGPGHRVSRRAATRRPQP
ncbi:hypothetical protein ARTHRO9V_100055 [Arthrobacter sp. 9V]|nr:hypothetical protein ARTHRO9V_100055 [Arthrobacter sp. 9V]